VIISPPDQGDTPSTRLGMLQQLGVIPGPGQTWA
jgi:hypothetical protein